VYNDHIADHAWMFVLAFARGLHVYARRQARREWNPGGVPVVHLADATLGVIGLGGIGQEVARRGRVAGMRVLAVDPRPTDKPGDAVDELFGPDRLNEVFSRADFVVICAPHTPQTEKMIRMPQLETMKRTAFLVNIGRGVIVDLADLTDALMDGVIAGAGLDVFETEPLPPDHPLWTMENVLLTPHTAGHAPHTAERRLRVVCDNVRRFVAGEPLTNVVDKANWF
jgi:phosphoglycerate dehydrogenase-like enzyme